MFSLSIRKRVVFLTLMLSSGFANAQTYDVSSFPLAGVTLGDSEKEVVQNIANYFGVEPEEIKLIREKEYPSKENVISASLDRRYEFDGNRVSIRLYPDYVNQNGDDLVVGYARYTLSKELDTAQKQRVIDDIKNKLASEKGEPSERLSIIEPLAVYYWCTELTEKKGWPCVLKKPYLQLDFNLSKLEDKRYDNAWRDAARNKALEK